MTPKEEILVGLKKALSQLGFKEEPQIERSSNIEYGDYSTNAALKFKIPPEKIVERIKKPKSIEKIEVRDGFINFWLSEDYLLDGLKRKLAPAQILKEKTILVEFTDPNPFKEFHVGHLYSNSIGESISRILESLGAAVLRLNYQGDVGLHVAKAVWALKFKVQSSKFKVLENKSPGERAKFLGQCYSEGDKAYESDQKARIEIEEMNKKIYKGDKEVKDLYDKGRKWSLEYFEEIYKRLGTKFQKYYFESQVGELGLTVVEENKKLFKKSDGAIIFEGEKYGLHNRVFINSKGLPTYEAKELGLAVQKSKDFKFDESIVITGNEIVEYFKVVKTALSKIEPKIAQKTRHISHGMVRIPHGKISSRAGNVLSYDWLIKAVKDKIRQDYQDMNEEVAEQVSLGAIKYALLKSRIGSDIEFDIQKSISLEGDSGPYLQYAYVRTASVLGKSSSSQYRKTSNVKRNGQRQRNLNPEEILLLRTLQKFPEIVNQAAAEYSPSVLCSYLFEVAKTFNMFYQKHRIAENQFRLDLSVRVGEILNKGLTLLGIESPKRM